MTTYSTTQTFEPETYVRTAHVIVIAGSGQVSIQALTSDDDTPVHIEGSPFTADEVMQIDIANGRFLVTPTGTAKFEWSAGW